MFLYLSLLSKQHIRFTCNFVHVLHGMRRFVFLSIRNFFFFKLGYVRDLHRSNYQTLRTVKRAVYRKHLFNVLSFFFTACLFVIALLIFPQGILFSKLHFFSKCLSHNLMTRSHDIQGQCPELVSLGQETGRREVVYAMTVPPSLYICIEKQPDI